MVYVLLVMRSRVAVPIAIAMLLSACGSPTSTGATPTSTSSVGMAAIRAEDREAGFVLVVEAPRASWHAGDLIEAQAMLSYVGGDSTTFSSSGAGPIVFSLAEVGGTRRMDGVRESDCAPWDIAADQPLVVPYRKSGSVNPGEPNEAFYNAFFADPVFRLPAGRWQMTADAELLTLPGCSGRHVELQATMTLLVE